MQDTLMPEDPPAALVPLLGARIEAAHFCPATGLLALVTYAGHKLILGAGIGPDAAGLGFLPRLPAARAPSSHPLVAALRAHLVDRRITRLYLDPNGALWIEAGPPDTPARLVIHASRKGHARVLAPSGASVVWPRGAEEARAITTNPSISNDLLDNPDALNNRGAALLEANDRRALEALRVALLRAVKARLKSLERREAAVRSDLARLDEAPRLQKIGRLLTAQASRIPRGATRAVLDDWEEGGAIEIPLDPDKPAKIQAETFFAKARRLQRGAAVMRTRLDETVRAGAHLPPIVDAIMEAPLELAALEALARRARAAGVSIADAEQPTAAGKSGRREPQERKPFHVFRASGGKAVLVGRGGKDNDALITRFARPHDLWLHAKNIHGAHVVVPLDKGSSCPADLLVDAATLAAHFSDARGESACEVSYVERRYVRKPKKSAPGAVTFDHEKIIAVRIEPERLARLLAAKEEV